MNHPQSSNTFSLPGWVAAIAFAAVVGSFFLVFFTVRVGDVEPAAIKGIDLVLGIGQAAVDVAPLGTVVLDQVTVADTSTTDPASSGSVADKARQLLKEHEKTRSEAPVPAVRRPSPEKTRAPMAIAVLACAVLGLVASLIPACVPLRCGHLRHCRPDLRGSADDGRERPSLGTSNRWYARCDRSPRSGAGHRLLGGHRWLGHGHAARGTRDGIVHTGINSSPGARKGIAHQAHRRGGHTGHAHLFLFRKEGESPGTRGTSPGAPATRSRDHRSRTCTSTSNRTRNT